MFCDAKKFCFFWFLHKIASRPVALISLLSLLILEILRLEIPLYTNLSPRLKLVLSTCSPSKHLSNLSVYQAYYIKGWTIFQRVSHLHIYSQRLVGRGFYFKIILSRKISPLTYIYFEKFLTQADWYFLFYSKPICKKLPFFIFGKSRIFNIG